MRSKILLADDDQSYVTVMSQFLQGEGFDVVVAYEGVRVIESAHKHKIDLILLDLKMPVGNGQSILESLKSRPETRSIPVIFLTGADDPTMEASLKARGAQDYLKKPFQKEILLKKIRELLSHPEAK